jgi:small subunit ribosomal protein S17
MSEDNIEQPDTSDADASSGGTASNTPDEAPAPEAPTVPSVSDAPVAVPSEPAEVLAPKERRQRARAAKAAKTPAGKPRTAEERHAERVEERAGKAVARRAERTRSRGKAKAAAAGRPAPEAIAAREHIQGAQKTRQGVVVSDRADKTITVRIDTARRHRRYQKIVRTSRTLHAHDERNDAHIGDTVMVRESRPLSRSKRWRLVDIIERAK